MILGAFTLFTPGVNAGLIDADSADNLDLRWGQTESNQILGFDEKQNQYISDRSVKVDYLLAKKSKVKFIFANYGYGKIENFYKFNKINSFKDLKNFI